MAVKYGSLPFKEQIDFFLTKTPVPTERWNDLQRDAHDSQFMAAGAMKADLKGVMNKAHTDGTTLREFTQDFERIVAKQGWTGWTGEDTKAGRAWRARVIYETNLRTSYQAGRWQQIQAVKKQRPYLIYRHSHAVVTPRDEHVAWDGLVVPVDSDWVQTHYPPNGFGCRCKMFALNDRDLAKMGKSGPDMPPYPYDGTYEWTDPKTGEVHTFPEGVQPFWDYAPGASLTDRARAQIERKIGGLPDGIGNQLAALIKRDHAADVEKAVLAMGVKQANFAGRLDIAQVTQKALTTLANKPLAMPDHVLINEDAFKTWAAQQNIPVESMTAAFTAHSVSDATYLFLNPLYAHWHNPATDAKYQFKSGYWSTDHSAHALHHEFGHLTHFMADKSFYRAVRLGLLTPDESVLAKKVSRYAAEGPIEFVAEVFAGLMAGRNFSADIMALYQQFKGVMP